MARARCSRSAASRRISRPTTAWCRRSTASTSRSTAARRVGVVGESGCGKTVTAMSVLKLIADAARAGSSPAQILWQGRDLVPLGADEMRPHPRQGDRDRLPGADDLAQPGLHRRRADRRGAAPARGAVAQARRIDKTVEMLRAGAASPIPSGACTTIRTSSPAACASA